MLARRGVVQMGACDGGGGHGLVKSHSLYSLTGEEQTQISKKIRIPAWHQQIRLSDLHSWLWLIASFFGEQGGMNLHMSATYLTIVTCRCFRLYFFFSLCDFCPQSRQGGRNSGLIGYQDKKAKSSCMRGFEEYYQTLSSSQ